MTEPHEVFIVWDARPTRRFPDDEEPSPSARVIAVRLDRDAAVEAQVAWVREHPQAGHEVYVSAHRLEA